jgi:uncharacterized protein YdaU (DUF1376 family)
MKACEGQPEACKVSVTTAASNGRRHLTTDDRESSEMADRNPSTPKGKAPAFQFYAQDILADFNVLAMTLEEFGAYVKLLALCWNEHGIPAADPDRIARALAITREHFDQLSPAISPCFYLDGSGRWQHKRLDEERRKQRKYRRAMQLNGLKGGRPQQSRGKAAGYQQQSRGLAEKSSSSSSSSSSSEVQERASRASVDRTKTGKHSASNPTYNAMRAWMAECHELHADSCQNQREHVGKIRKAVAS